MTTLFFRLSLILMFATLAACGKGFSAREVSDDPGLTGAQNQNGLPYTSASSDTDELESLKQSIDPASQANLNLAASVQGVVIRRLDGSGQPAAHTPSQLEIQLQLGTAAPVTFNAKLQTLGRSLEARELTAPASDLKLNARCLDSDCLAIELRLSNSQQSEAGIVYRIRRAKVEFLGPFAATAKTVKLTHLKTLITNAQNPLLVTTEVAWGPATFELQAGDVVARGDLVATGGNEENVSVAVKNEPPVDGRLLGNSERGDLLLRLAEDSSWAFVRVRITPPTAPVADDSADDAAVPASQRFIPYDLTNPITATLQKDKVNPVIQAEIAARSKGGGAAELKTFLNRAQPNLDQILPALAEAKVPPEFVFIIAVESTKYFGTSGFPIEISAPGAVGPWQFMPATAKGYGLKIFPITIATSKDAKGHVTKTRVANRCDERANLALSTKAAAKYFRRLLDLFPNDPKLAVMAYNLGEDKLGTRLNNLNRKMNCKGDANCMKTIKPFEMTDVRGLTYWDVREFKAAPTESINYVPRFLGAQFVGREPGKYGIKVDPGFPRVTNTCH